MATNEIHEKTANNYYCEMCDFKCFKASNFTTHLFTAKHKRLTISCQKMPKNANILECMCGKNYKHMSSLCKHKKICPDVNQYKLLQDNKINVTPPGTNTDPNITLDIDTESDIDTNTNTNTEANPGLLKDNLIEYLIKENSEFKNLIMELIKKDFTNNTNTNNTIVNNNNNNNSFNLNVFLNDKCKGAMNMSEFMDTINIQMCDLENFAYVDYANGVSKILLKNLENIEAYLRPIHCSDLKRETLYIKENDCWTKETDDKPNLKKQLNKSHLKI